MVQTKVVYRLEDEDGIGPYSTDLPGVQDYVCVVHRRRAEAGKKLPCPNTDNGINRQIYPWEVCAFIDKKQMNEWIADSEIEVLNRMGVKLRRIKAQITARGTYQILIKKGGECVY